MSPRNPKNRNLKTTVRGPAAIKRTALMLFGIDHKMEKPEEREHMALVLRNSDQPAMRQLAAQAMDKDFRVVSFAALAERNRVNYHMISDEYKKIMRSEGFIRQARHLPELMETAAIDAKSKMVECETCDGKGEVPDLEAYNKLKREAKQAKEPAPVECPRKRCPRCKGAKEVWMLGDTDRLKMIFETYGLTGKTGAGVNILNIAGAGAPTAPETMSDLAASVAPIIEGEFK